MPYDHLLTSENCEHNFFIGLT